MTDALTRDTFAGRLNEAFRLDLGTNFPGLAALELILIEADPVETQQDLGDRRPPFTLLFRGPAEPVLAQSVYKLDNDVLGTLDIFLVPIGQDDQGMRYESVFN